MDEISAIRAVQAQERRRPRTYEESISALAEVLIEERLSQSEDKTLGIRCMALFPVWTPGNYIAGDVGKTWVLFGDSLTDPYGGHDWQESTSPVGGIGWEDSSDPTGTDRTPWTGYFWATKIARKHGLIIDNRGESGSCMYYSRVYSDVSGVLILDAFIAEIQAGTISAPDFITVGFGANHVADEKGTADDAASNETKSWYAGAKYFCDKLKEYCPRSEILFIGTPKQSGWRDSNNDSNAVIQEVVASYGYRFIDLSSTDYSGISVDMLPDSLHVSSVEANNAYFRAIDKAMF